jgi:hypothetical protein
LSVHVSASEIEGCAMKIISIDKNRNRKVFFDGILIIPPVKLFLKFFGLNFINL